MELTAKVLTVSDSSFDGRRADRSGPALVDLLERHGFVVAELRVVPDGVESVAGALRDLAEGYAGLIVTTGGTGFAPRDLTPEATRSVIERDAPGLAEAARAVNPLGRLARGVAGTIGKTLILNVPGSPAGATESLDAVIDVLPHALAQLTGEHSHH